MTRRRIVTIVPLAAILGCWLAAASQDGAGPEKRSRLEAVPVLVSLAEREGISFVCPSGEGMPLIAKSKLTQDITFSAAVRAAFCTADVLEGVTWVRWPFGVGPLEEAEPKSLRDAKGALADSANRLGLALIASLTDAQNQWLRRPWRALDIIEVYFWQKEYLKHLKMGGCLTGDKMTDFQRRLCAAAVYASTHEFYPWEKLLNCEEAALGDFYIEHREPFWYPEIQLCNRRDLRLSDDMRSGSYDTPWFTIHCSLPAVVVEREELEQVVGVLPSRPVLRQPDVRLPPPRCRHTTDGPGRAVTELLDPQEAQLGVPVPSDIRQATFREIFQGLGAGGYTFDVPKHIADVLLVWGPVGGEVGPSGRPVVPGMTLLGALNGIVQSDSQAAWVREGKTFRLVYDWEQAGNIAVDGTKVVPSEFLEKPVTLTAEAATVPELLAAIREQTGAPVYPSQAVEEMKFQVGVRFKHVPVRAVVRQLAAYLDGAWERADDGKVYLVPRTYLQVTPRDLHPAHALKRRMTSAGMALSLLLETLTEEQYRAASEGQLALEDLSPISNHLLSALAHSALGVPDALPEGVKLSGLHQSEGGYSATVSAGGKSQILASVEPPTIPPNPPGERLLVRAGG